MKAVDWAFRSHETGRIVVVQLPNAALWAFVLARGSDRILELETPWSIWLEVVATLAIVWWAVDELVRGVNPWRRLLGASMLVFQLVAVVR